MLILFNKINFIRTSRNQINHRFRHVSLIQYHHNPHRKTKHNTQHKTPSFYIHFQSINPFGRRWRSISPLAPANNRRQKRRSNPPRGQWHTHTQLKMDEGRLESRRPFLRNDNGTLTIQEAQLIIAYRRLVRRPRGKL